MTSTEENDIVNVDARDFELEEAEADNKAVGVLLPSRDDPFAPREGKTLIWKDVNMTLAEGKDGKDKKILSNVWGEVPQHKTTAIMGPSGAGKSSLLNILSGRAKSNGKLTITADVRLNNYTVDPTNINVRKMIAFVAQDDSLPVTSTPREALYFSAKLRLPRSTSEEQLHALTERMLEELGLTHCADTIVGGPLLKGISGGERKRTSVGVELVVKPTLVFLDEPTSGLDSFSALQLCQVLKKVANAGASVLFTIHQPGSEIFDSFDHLILMNKGQVMYQGSVESVPQYFSDREHPIPPKYNPADWIMNVAQKYDFDRLERDGFFPKDNRVIGEAFVPSEGQDALGITIATRRSSTVSSDEAEDQYKPIDMAPPGFFLQTKLLFVREWQNLKRDTAAIGTRMGSTAFLSILVGAIFFEVGETDSSESFNLQSHFGALIMVLLMSMFGTAQPALISFPTERPVFLREYSTNHYSVVSYFMSRLTMEAIVTALQMLLMCMLSYFLIGLQMNFSILFGVTFVLAMGSTALAVLLGAGLESPAMAQEMLPILFVPQMLFAGFFVAPDLIPEWLRWARYLCTLTYAVRILLVAEFEDCDPGNPEANDSCNDLLDTVEADPDEVWWNWLLLIVLFACFRSMALFVLRSKATKFY